MKITSLVEQATAQGFQFWIDNDKARFRGDIEMKPELLTDLRKHKSDLLAYLKLRVIANELDWPLSDLIESYSGHLDEITSRNIEGVRFVVKDYIKNIDLYREGLNQNTTGSR